MNFRVGNFGMEPNSRECKNQKVKLNKGLLKIVQKMDYPIVVNINEVFDFQPSRISLYI